MKLIIMKEGIGIWTENPRDVVLIEEVLKLKKYGDYRPLVRIDTYAKIGGLFYLGATKADIEER